MAYDKVIDSAKLNTDLTTVADAIRAKGGTSDALSFPTGFKTAIEAIQTGGGGGGGGSVVSAPMKDVNFYDYDGTRLYSYTVAEAQALTELPALPTQPGLICQGWNWTLEDIKAMNRAVDVGAIYITDDGKTRLYIRIESEGRMTVPLYISQTVANGVTIDWGDGTAAETLSGTGNVNTTHTYASIGDYVITLNVANGCALGFGNNSNSYCVVGSTANSNRVYCSMLHKVEIGERVTSVGKSAFRVCASLSSITIPNGVTKFGDNTFVGCPALRNVIFPNGITNTAGSTFSYCRSLKLVVLPNGVTKLGSYVFEYCESLANVVIPNSVNTINSYAFTKSGSLSSITIPNGVTNIISSAFDTCYGMAIYDFTNHTVVPTLESTSSFNGIASDCQFRVPAALVDEWKAATNWSTYASQIVGV